MDTTTVNTIIDTTLTKVDSTLVNDTVNAVVEKTGFFADKGVLTATLIIGGILLALIGLWVWDVIEDKRNSKK